MVVFNSCEAEYIILNKVGKEVIWLQRFLKELVLINYFFFPTLIYKNNQSTIVLANNPEYYRRTKHINIQYH